MLDYFGSDIVIAHAVGAKELTAVNFFVHFKGLL